MKPTYVALVAATVKAKACWLHAKKNKLGAHCLAVSNLEVISFIVKIHLEFDDVLSLFCFPIVGRTIWHPKECHQPPVQKKGPGGQ